MPDLDGMPNPIGPSHTPARVPVNDEPPPPELPKTASPPPNSGLSEAARQLAQKHGGASGLGLPAQRPPAAWYGEKLASEAACLLPCDLALRAAKLNMPEGGIAQQTMDHFLSGSASPATYNLNAELSRNPQLREYVASRIEAEIAERFADRVPLTDMSGAIWVSQSAYGKSPAGKDQSLALGGTYFEYQVAGSADNGGLEVRVNVADHYFWSPSELSRPTHCLHECGSSLVAAGRAVEFYQLGEGTLIVNDPSRGAAMEPLEVESRNND